MKKITTKFVNFINESKEDTLTISEVIKIVKDNKLNLYDIETMCKFIYDNYEDITGSEYTNKTDMSMEDNIADLLGFYKHDGHNFSKTWTKMFGK